MTGCGCDFLGRSAVGSVISGVETKWLSNDRNVLQSIPPEHRAANVRHLDLQLDKLPGERALGVSWMPDTDNFSVSVYEKPAVMTRRGLCSMYSSVYDPLGFVAPSVLIARLLYRHECTLGKDWDDDLEPDNVRAFKK